MPTIAFFGPTGGCANACLAYTLRNGYDVIALARTPSKLTAQLLEQPGLTPALLEKHLHIVQGDATDVDAVTQTLLVHDDGATCTLVSSIISGMGGTGTMAFTKPSPCDKVPLRMPTLPHITIANPHITEQFTRTLLAALRGLAARFPSYAAYKEACPRLTVISTTGIRRGVKDLPTLMKPMYAMMGVPHADKEQMEKVLAAELGREQTLLCRGLVIVRPSFLSGDHRIAAEGEDSGYGRLRVGTDGSPAVGYTVGRPLIGQWIFEEIVKRGGDRWVGEGVMLTE
ncbi:hypothetical protein N7462_003445 [Penicillium macrosclerotiorum]|uniref:uncharacterized protein n=1 Tax=Penicillium macrosclerotiorum TaxID=303699 RepID=UPI0025474A9F|nr:uncharacterized protein N7462_003445 [Penicillium macrosclerotiorum]KAJ5689053.1 hypothetical protein N7462_003445 [Penicillium macrosclerotiorum]